MGRDWVLEMLGHAPSQFTITPRNADREITIGGKHILFGNVSSPPNYFDLEIGKKVSGTRAQCANLLRLTQYFNCIHFAGGYPVEPIDLPSRTRHLNCVADMAIMAGTGLIFVASLRASLRGGEQGKAE